MTDIVFGIDRELDKFCPVCGRPIYQGDGGCPKLHKIRPPKIKKYSGKSNSVNKYNDYKD
jgi:hypothetical protein